MTPQKRSKLMSRIRATNTGPEKQVAAILKRESIAYNKNDKSLPGKPDFVLKTDHAVIFVDGDFWHGWQFPRWKSKLPKFWQKKIGANVRRDQKNFRLLRRRGWKVIRIWEHQIEKNKGLLAARLVEQLRTTRQ
jgi:DNA mismatch endonuclease (patch repair protein)